MKLTGIFPSLKTEKVQVKKPEGSVVSATDKTALPTDRVVLSSGSLEVQKVRDILAQTPEVRADRVKALKEEIARGEYKIDPARLADKMMVDLLSETLA
ncbi:MAG: flagellar biosynthesis anti-sigma factor FlgM [Deltaproteobacteria bacterium RIFOXYD12_FULL_56_24]|nr:MAG: flagellar biosynthesis anti-sigma factor FlgM [Deltaproteobacteria bacterium RIFOXYD12_FULL_56_24]